MIVVSSVSSKHLRVWFVSLLKRVHTREAQLIATHPACKDKGANEAGPASDGLEGIWIKHWTTVAHWQLYSRRAAQRNSLSARTQCLRFRFGAPLWLLWSIWVWSQRMAWNRFNTEVVWAWCVALWGASTSHMLSCAVASHTPLQPIIFVPVPITCCFCLSLLRFCRGRRLPKSCWRCYVWVAIFVPPHNKRSINYQSSSWARQAILALPLHSLLAVNRQCYMYIIQYVYIYIYIYREREMFIIIYIYIYMCIINRNVARVTCVGMSASSSDYESWQPRSWPCRPRCSDFSSSRSWPRPQLQEMPNK